MLSPETGRLAGQAGPEVAGDAGLVLPVGRGVGDSLDSDLNQLGLDNLAQVSFNKLLTCGFKIMRRGLSAFYS